MCGCDKTQKSLRQFKTKSSIESKIDSGSIKAGVSQVQYIKEGGVAKSCGCEMEEDLVIVSENMKMQMKMWEKMKILQKNLS